MDPFETQLHRTITVLEEMLFDYMNHVPAVYHEQFKKAVNTQIGRAKSQLILLDNLS